MFYSINFKLIKKKRGGDIEMENFKINHLKDATLLEDNKLRLIYDCSNDSKIAEIEYVVDLNENAQVAIKHESRHTWEFDRDASKIRESFPIYNPYSHIAFMFETTKAYEVRVVDRVKKMTVEDIEKQLGYKVEIVSK